MITQDDINTLVQARNMIDKVIPHVDCPYCRSHIETISDLIGDVTDISRLNLLYDEDPEALEKLRNMIQSENLLRLMAVGSKMIGWTRRFRHRIAHGNPSSRYGKV